MVVASHALEYPIRRHILTDDFYRVAWVIGWLAVATFFVLSGLIIIRSSYDRFRQPGATADFATQRFLRVVPLYWLVMLPMGAATVMRGETVDLAMVLKSMFFIPYYSDSQGAMRPIVGQGWTLNFEMMFYGLFALALFFQRRTGLLILVGIITSAVVLRSFVWPLTDFEDARTPLQFWTDPLVLLFAVGLLVGLFERTGAVRRFSVRYPIPCTLALLTAAGASFLWLGGSFPMPIGWQALLASICTLGVVLCAAGRNREPSWSDRLLERSGDASYSMYLVHPPFLMALALILPRISPALLHPLVFVPAAIVVCNLAGWVTYVTVERPMTRWVRGRAKASQERLSANAARSMSGPRAAERSV